MAGRRRFHHHVHVKPAQGGAKSDGVPGPGCSRPLPWSFAGSPEAAWVPHPEQQALGLWGHVCSDSELGDFSGSPTAHLQPGCKSLVIQHV